MSEISVEIGKRVHDFRKRRNMTLQEMSGLIHKSKSTISKYESGEISIDIETLYEIADTLHIHVEQLLYRRPERAIMKKRENGPVFFNGASQFYSYLFDGRINRLLRCVFDVVSELDDNSYKVMMYMNFRDYEHYQHCENTYIGFMEHYDAITHIQLTNQDTPMEKASVQILASYLDAETKWGLFNGLSSRPMMPIAIKMLFSKSPLKEDDSLIKMLKVSREDIRLLKLYNMLPVT